MALNLKIDVEELVASFKRAEARLSENIPVALNLAGDLVVAEAKRFHDYKDRTGVLTNSIVRDEVQGNFEGGDLNVAVSAGAPHALFVEKGTRAHKIRPRFRKALRWPVEGGFAFAKEVSHPGTKATEFLSNAGLAKIPEIEQVIEDAALLSFHQAGFEVQ